MNPELLRYARKWTEDTERMLKSRVDKFKIKGRGFLKPSIQARLKSQDKKIVIEVRMKISGKFVDMGAGTNQAANTQTTKRKPNPWSNRFLWGRIRGLNKVVNLQVREMAKRIFRD